MGWGVSGEPEFAPPTGPESAVEVNKVIPGE